MKPQHSPSMPCAPRASSTHGPLASPHLLAHLETALAAAARLAAPYPEEAEAIERVIRYVRSLSYGLPDRVQLRDVLLALSILWTAPHRAPTAEDLESYAFLEAALRICTPSRRRTEWRQHRPSTSGVPSHRRLAA